VLRPPTSDDAAARSDAATAPRTSPRVDSGRLPKLPYQPNEVRIAKQHLVSLRLHLLRNSFKYASRRDWAAIARDLKPVYTAATEQAALDRFAGFAATWEKKYPAIIRLWTSAWAEMVPFLAFDTEIRGIICTTNAIESLNARFRRAVNARGHFPNEQAAMKVLYLTVIGLDPTGKGQKRWSNRWKAALNAFEMTFDGRLSAPRV
jgi:putative transposase